MISSDLIPADKTEAVSRALRETFAVTDFEDITAMTGGHTNSLVFRIIVGGSPYLLKLILRNEDPTRHYTSMSAAAEAGIAPRVWYTSVEDRLAITDFVTAQTLPVKDALQRLPAVLRTLHALPPFGRAPFNTTCTFLLNKGPALDGFMGRFLGGKALPDADCAEFTACLAELAAVYPYDDSAMVASHNDQLKPDNILFDGQRIWFIDWEAAFLNDRYVDLAMIANQVVTSDEEESVYLREYFDAPPSEYQRARFHLMQQLTHLFYTMGFLTLGAAGQPVDWSGEVPGFGEFQRRWWSGEINIGSNESKLLAGKVHWKQLLHNVRQPRYKEALSIIGQ